ncbi:16S rRNA (cytosine(1402)-N(4))-methyltransferase RsmH [Wenzhouxiangella sp. XN79A]|uniref:16S rRNA (cytosine(1402)-N(4))-methyltransferase RsmH n=1 Tax=Wenzhouxiangella sp. XN79A TaxID=2724193 RepID=UPI00144AA0F4|nr:16S rRNA (cytosine(1402)-N(4))-methyltransferase RsmH [Wenzhouxiangella sp. XN79A]
MAHVPVLLEAAVDALNVTEDGTYVDATFGRGGHSARILERLGPSGRLIAIDLDPEALAVGRQRFGDDARVRFVQASFGELGERADELGLRGRVDGLLMDLGVSSPQLDDPARGFSFREDGPLDMRMNPEAGPSAADWLASVDEAELTEVLFRFGEERHSRRIAQAIVRARAETPITGTVQLAGIIRAAVPKAAAARDRIDPATRSFQAIRIAVNGELDAIERALDAALELLAAGGRLAVISFHSLEDRIVKRFIREHARPPAASRRRPAAPFSARLREIGKLVRPDQAEQQANPRARSARMRVAERLATPAAGGAA